ncbi:CHAT domain-containing protein [Mycena metata]|uniref:CHAT domain-containing protein n=1 Tax=Mycena metata TaxID=1033252 RepID=A0AAD7NNX2_9AGAR|nr:CHAT domain-containing protein [Mycena metata]
MDVKCYNFAPQLSSPRGVCVIYSTVLWPSLTTPIMSRIAHLHDICVTSTNNPHPDLPTSMQMFAQLIVDGTIIQQATPVDMEPTLALEGEHTTNSSTWKFKFGCDIPPHAHTFWIAILRQGQGIRLVGSIEIAQGEALLFGERPEALCLPLVKVNPDGPLLNLTATFLISTWSQELSGPAGNNIMGTEMGAVNAPAIVARMTQMLGDTGSENQWDPQELWIMHERILLLSFTEQRSKLLNVLGNICLQHWRVSQMIDVLNQAVTAYDDAVRDGLMNASSLDDLGIGLLHRFQQLGNIGDITKCISVMQDAAHLTPDGHPDKPSRLNNLGGSLLARFERLGDLGDLDKSVSMREDAASLTPDGHPDKPSRLNNLGNSLSRRFERLGDLGDLNRSVSIGEKAASLTPDGHPDKPFCLNNLGNSIFRRFEQLGDLGDLNKAMLMREDVVHLTHDGHPAKPSRLNNLGGSLLARFERLGNLDDLNKAVLVLEDAAHLTPAGHTDKPSMLNNLGNSLFHRFEQLSDLGDLNKAVLVLEDAVCLAPDGHQDKLSMLNNLGNSLLARFEWVGDLGDLNRSVLMREDVACQTPDGHPDQPSRLINLGGSLLARFERLGDLGDLNRSVSIGEKAASLTPDGHPDKPFCLNNLGNSIFRRFEQLGDLGDLNKAMLMREDVVHLTHDGHPAKPSRLNNLGGSLLARFERLGNLDDLNKAVLVLENAAHLTPDGHPAKPSRLKNLGNSLFHRFEQLGDLGDLNKAVLVLKDAAYSITGPAHIRFDAASQWAELAQIAKLPSLLDAYEIVLALLPELAWLGLSISDRHYHLLQASKVVRNAAAVAIASDQAEKAVEWLEQGRSVIWGQLLNLRSPVDVLSNSYPGLAKRLLSLSAQLERSGTRASEQEPITSGTGPSLQSVADRAHQNAHEREQLLKKIRSLEGFTRFLLPKLISELSLAAKAGPVVILNTSETRCDALILMPGLKDEVLHILLPKFTPQDAGSLAYSVSDLVHHRGQSDRLSGTREGRLPQEEEFAKNLSEVWFKIAQPILDGLAITTPAQESLPRIWWCPTGPLSFFPIHAAGLYGSNDTFGSKLSDVVISSYAPSLTALMEGFRVSSESQQALQLLAVAEPSAFGAGYIPGTQEEIRHIEQLALGKLPVLLLEKDMATVDRVQQEMRNSRWVHFACHGVQDMSHPTESALILAGGSRLTLSKIIQLALPHADLAFLSACQTATGDKSLEEESVHLAAGMLLAGYRGVIATMWTIMDNDAPQVASDVYEHLFKVSPPDPTQAAEALHLALQKLRKGSGTRKSFFQWVPFIHVGV